MSSMTPSDSFRGSHGSHGSTDTLTVDLAAIHQDTTWPVDPDLVASFRASIRRGEPPLLDLSLNRLRLADGASGLEIIDGMHRLEALRLEGVTTHSAKVREYSPQDAFYARIATSIGKPNELFRLRAERALREGFVQDVAEHLDGATLYQRGIAEDGTPRPTPRREPLPADPLLALGTILWVHFAAKPEVTEDWERYVLTWLEDIAQRLGKTPAWLRDEVLHITALLGEDLPGKPGKPAAERARLLLAIPDDGIMRLALARLKAEPKLTTTDLRFALDILGCGPDVGRHNWLKPRSLPEMRSMLAHATLSQLARDYGHALKRAEDAARAIRPPASSYPQATTAPTAPMLNPAPVSASGSHAHAPSTSPSSPSAPSPDAPDTLDAPLAPLVPTPGVSQPGAQSGTQPGTETGILPPSVAGASSGSADRRAADESNNPPPAGQESNTVFGVVSARFGRAVSHVEHETAVQRTPPTPPATGNIGTSSASPTSSAASADSFLSAHRLIDAVIGALHAFDQRGGDWSRSDIRQELIQLRTLIDTYLTRGADRART